MDINQENINSFLNKYITFVDRVSKKYTYPNNIKHVLYLIIPAFISKYGINYENIILQCFWNIPIIINEKENDYCTAYFARRLKLNMPERNPLFISEKIIVLQQYKNASLTDMFDNIIHEFNHALNSLTNEIKYDENTVSMRTGLIYSVYSRNNLLEPINKGDCITLEEIINTKQTELIIEIIKSFSKYKIDNEEFNSCLYTIEKEIVKSYRSNAYLLQSSICRELMQNKTFIPTVENLRFKGNVDDIPIWFDNITNKEGSFKKLSRLLDELLEDEQIYIKAKWLKKIKLNKIKEKIRSIHEIIDLFEKNCIYK